MVAFETSLYKFNKPISNKYILNMNKINQENKFIVVGFLPYSYRTYKMRKRQRIKNRKIFQRNGGGEKIYKNMNRIFLMMI